MSEKHECHVTDIGYVNPINIRWKVCSALPAEFEHNGKFYCALHLPLDKKVDETNFNEILKERLENEQFDLRGVYFPSPFFFKEGIHKNPVDFSAAIFSQGGYFRLSTFESDAEFIGTQFFYGDFSSSTFKKYCSFKGAVFNAITVDMLIGKNVEFQGAHLPRTTFEGHTDFSEVQFFSNADFQSSTFLNNTYFIKTKFSI